MTGKAFGWILVALTAVAMTGCGGGTNSGDLPDPKVRFINGCPSTDNIDLYLNDTRFSANIPYLGSSTSFQEIEFLTADVDGGYDVAVRTAGGTADLDIENTSFNRDTSTVILSLGLPDPGGELLKRARILFLGIDRKAPNGNRSRLTVVNALQRAVGFETPPVTFQSIIPGDPTSIDNPQFRESDIIYAAVRTLTIDSGTRTFIARRGEVDGLLQFAQQTFTFQPGAIYVALITGQEANSNASLQPRIEFIQLETEN